MLCKQHSDAENFRNFTSEKWRPDIFVGFGTEVQSIFKKDVFKAFVSTGISRIFVKLRNNIDHIKIGELFGLRSIFSDLFIVILHAFDSARTVGSRLEVECGHNRELHIGKIRLCKGVQPHGHLHRFIVALRNMMQKLTLAILVKLQKLSAIYINLLTKGNSHTVNVQNLKKHSIAWFTNMLYAKAFQLKKQAAKFKIFCNLHIFKF